MNVFFYILLRVYVVYLFIFFCIRKDFFFFNAELVVALGLLLFFIFFINMVIGFIYFLFMLRVEYIGTLYNSILLLYNFILTKLYTIFIDYYFDEFLSKSGRSRVNSKQREQFDRDIDKLMEEIKGTNVSYRDIDKMIRTDVDYMQYLQYDRDDEIMRTNVRSFFFLWCTNQYWGFFYNLDQVFIIIHNLLTKLGTFLFLNINTIDYYLNFGNKVYNNYVVFFVMVMYFCE